MTLVLARHHEAPSEEPSRGDCVRELLREGPGGIERSNDVATGVSDQSTDFRTHRSPVLQPALQPVTTGDVHRCQSDRLADVGLAILKINHDLRNLLAAALIHAERLQASNSDEVRRLAPRLGSAIERAVTYTQAVLAYCDASARRPTRQLTNLAHIVDELANLLNLGADGDVGFTADIPVGFAVDADPEQLFRVLLNLMRNAVQAMERRPGERQITVSARRDNGGVRIVVRDTGPGVPSRMREGLFQPFRTTGANGTGLGLTVAADLVNAHGGRITLLDSASGAAFAIDIPDTPSPSETSALPQPGPPN